MKVYRVTKKIKVKRASIDEILSDNRPYFEALAERYGEKYAAEAQRRFLQEVAAELESVPEEEEVIEVPMIQIGKPDLRETT